VFYETRDNKHGLKHDPFKALAVPRPIGWVSTIGKNGICNIAPYSFFNAVGEKPHYVLFSSAGPKDSLLTSRRPASSCARSRPGTCATT
jgi:flavin reductase (DIM6/NTAB) family NADH-FMN oxidoreductase RutF